MRKLWALQKEQMVLLLKLELQMQYCRCECSCFNSWFSTSCLLGFQDHELMIHICGLCIQLQDWEQASRCEVDADKTVVGTTLLGCTNGKLSTYNKVQLGWCTIQYSLVLIRVDLYVSIWPCWLLGE
jgi:hypothetical protein